MSGELGLHLLLSFQQSLIHVREARTIHEALDHVLQAACQWVGASHGSIVRVDLQQGDLEIISTQGAGWSTQMRESRLKLGEGITGKVARTGEPFLCENAQTCSEYICFIPSVRSEMALPVRLGEEVWGVLSLDFDTAGAIHAAHTNLGQCACELAATAIHIFREKERQQLLQERLIQTDKLASLGQVIAGIAHEINNPLTSIMGHIALMELNEGKPVSSAQLAPVASEARRVADLVKDLLSFSRRSPERPQLHPINDIVRKTNPLMKHQFKGKGIQLRMNLCEEEAMVLVDERQIQQVLINLIGNALHSVEERIQKQDSEEKGFVELETVLCGKDAYIHVMDNGMGIPNEVRQRIFDPFFTTKAEGKGTGLGLSIAQAILAKYGGDLTLDTPENSEIRTMFRIRIPQSNGEELKLKITTSPQSSPAPTLNGSQPAIRKNRILIIEDEPALLSSVSEFLAMRGMDVISVPSAEEASSVMQGAEPFDVIVSDIRLPGMDGIDFYHATIKNNPRYEGKTIFISGDLMRDATREKLRTTNCFCLEKPFSYPILYQTIQMQAGQETLHVAFS